MPINRKSDASTTPDRGRNTLQARGSRDSKSKSGATIDTTRGLQTPTRTPGKGKSFSPQEKSERRAERDHLRMQHLIAPLEEEQDYDIDEQDDRRVNDDGGGSADADGDIDMGVQSEAPDVYVKLVPRADRKPNGGLTTKGAVPVLFEKPSGLPNNGRHKGRQLIRWHAAADQLLLLVIQYECYKHGLHLPWDAIARRFANEKGPPTAQCMIQHLSKLRGHMLDSGRWVPPLMGRQQQRQMASNDDVRGNVRYLRDGVAEVRDVDWDEDLSHLINPMEIQPLPPTRTAGGRKLHENPDAEMTTVGATGSPGDGVSPHYTPGSATRVMKRTPGSGVRKPKPQTRIKFEAIEADPADFDSDDDYHPGQKKKAKRTLPSRSARAKAAYRLANVTDEEDPVNSDEDEKETSTKDKAPGSVRTKYHSEEEMERDEFLNGPKSKIVKLKAGRGLIDFKRTGNQSNYYNEDNAQGQVVPYEKKTERGGADTIISKPVLQMDDDPFSGDSATPFDNFAANAGAHIGHQVSLTKADGTRYPKLFERVIMNFNSGKFTASTAIELWEQCIEDTSDDPSSFQAAGAVDGEEHNPHHDIITTFIQYDKNNDRIGLDGSRSFDSEADGQNGGDSDSVIVSHDQVSSDLRGADFNDYVDPAEFHHQLQHHQYEGQFQLDQFEDPNFEY